MINDIANQESSSNQKDIRKIDMELAHLKAALDSFKTPMSHVSTFLRSQASPGDMESGVLSWEDQGAEKNIAT
jgi:hypothetical protein